MPEALNCTCGSYVFFITPYKIMCKVCLKTYSLEDIKSMQDDYKSSKKELT